MTKWPYGFRIGPRKWQDWYRGLVRAVELAKASKDSMVLVLSDVQIKGGRHEADTYAETLKELGCQNLKVIRKGKETMGQIDFIRKAAGALAEKIPGVELILISSFLHHWRVQRLARGLKATHITTWGMPIPTNALTDIFLTLLFPIIDKLGGREWFRDLAVKRRASGKLH